MKTIKTIILFLLCVIASSCVHQFPEPTTPAQLDITLDFTTDMPYFRTVRFPEETAPNLDYEDDPDNKPAYFDYILPDWQTNSEKYRIRYIVEAYRVMANGRIASAAEHRAEFYDDDATQWDDHDISLILPEGRYEIRVWADYIYKNTTTHLYYNAARFNGITLDLSNGHHGNTDFRDAFSGKAQADVIRYGSIAEPVHLTVPMARPMGKYVFVTNDLNEFATRVLMNKYGKLSESAESATKSPDFDINDYTLTIRCSQWMPTSYSMLTDRANDSQVNVQFTSGLTQIDDNHAIMGFDYVLANPEDDINPVTKVVLDIILQDKEENVLATHQGVYVPLKRSKMTLVEGQFLIQESGGGVSINPGFNGPDIVVPVN